ncbi:TPA: flagellar motor switch protein FliG [Salmonella enterica subsp. enterica serovar Muenchen]|nr:flagellar motor switch protein FliG [Salmonella enterica]EJH1054361.1 flagellar motor switch protein FliG [Salmonella enterica]HEC7758624.1 flagellar motor switch protein FliG [Salmonella enterica subsp. enterica serovar Muenchen]HEC8860520.1 flagellar motor switch protein FliG [Salmonella enterica subsp. enterica serovar Muenchen]
MNAAQRCAIIMLSLGEERATEVFKHLNTHEVTQISSAMIGASSFTHEQIAQTMDEFYQESEDYASISLNASDYLRNVLVNALGEARASSLLDNLLEAQEGCNGIETLDLMEPYMVYDLIREEHPQIIATILAYLKRAQAANVLAEFDEQERNDIMLRIATFGGVQPVAMQELTDSLNNLLNGQNLKRNSMGGVRPTAEILNLLKSQHEEGAIDAIRKFDPELAQKIIDEMFLFENLLNMEDMSIQRILQEVENKSLVIALKGSAPELREKFFRNMSKRQSDILRDDLNNLGPVRMTQVEAEQKSILLIVRRLVEAGEVDVGGNDDVYV